MSGSGPRSGSLHLWALPISSELVAVWIELPAAAQDVSVAPKAGAADLLFRKRLISRGRRLHIFVLNTSQVQTTSAYVVTYRADRDGLATSADVVALLPEWTTPSVSTVIFSVLDGLAARDGDVDTRPLARFLSLRSAWSAPCRFAGKDSGLCVGVFDFAAPRLAELNALAVARGMVATLRVRVLADGEHGCCVMWPGESVERLYLDLDGDLVELAFNPPRSAPDSVLAWFASLPPRQQDALCEGISGMPSDDELAALLVRLGDQIPRARTLEAGQVSVAVLAVFAIGSRVYGLVDVPNDRPVSLSWWTAPGDEHPFVVVSTFRFADRPTRLILRSSAPHPNGMGDRPLRITAVGGGSRLSFWLPIQRLEDREARRHVCSLIDWERVDETLVRDFASAIARDERQSAVSPHPMMSLMGGEPARTAPLVICRYNGDLSGLRATLLSFRLTSGDDVAVRLVWRGRPSSAEVLTLRAAIECFRLRVELLVLDEHSPFSDALRLDPNDHRSVIVMESGVVALEPAWWRRLASLIEPSRGFYAVVDGTAADTTSALGYLAGTSPMIVLGPQVASELLDHSPEFQTLEGVARHVLSAAESVERVEWLRLSTFGHSTAKTTGVGGARLDDAVIAALLSGPQLVANSGEDNLVHLGAARAGTG